MSDRRQSIRMRTQAAQAMAPGSSAPPLTSQELEHRRRYAFVFDDAVGPRAEQGLQDQLAVFLAGQTIPLEQCQVGLDHDQALAGVRRQSAHG